MPSTGARTTRPARCLEPILKPLWGAYACLKRGRDAREPLDLDLPERKVVLTKEGFVDRVVVPERLDAHKLVEEFMIQANVAAAETLEKKRTPLLYRIHDASSPEKLESLRDFLSTLDISLPKAGNLRPSHFNGILKRVVDTPNAELVNTVVLRSPGAGGIRAGQHRPFRAEPAPLRPLHLADPPLFGPHRPSAA